MKSKFERFAKQAKFHLGIMARGLLRTLHGTMIAGLIGFSIYGFLLIKNEGGYAAVFDFIASCAILVMALANAYLLGCKRGKKK